MVCSCPSLDSSLGLWNAGCAVMGKDLGCEGDACWLIKVVAMEHLHIGIRANGEGLLNLPVTLTFSFLPLPYTCALSFSEGKRKAKKKNTSGFW